MALPFRLQTPSWNHHRPDHSTQFSDGLLVFGTLERYNGLRKAFMEARRKAGPDEEEIAILGANMIRHLDFIIATSLAIKNEAIAVQHLLFIKSEKHFGNAEFLRLSDD
jgi:hypothetical protein